MRDPISTKPTPSTLGALNRRVATAACLGGAIFLAVSAWQIDDYIRALSTNGMTVEGRVIETTLRPCMFGDFCHRKNRPDLTHRGFATIVYADASGRSHQTRHEINNESVRRFGRGATVTVTFPADHPTRAAIGEPERNMRGRQVGKILATLGALALLGAAFWIGTLPDYELTDGKPGGRRDSDWGGEGGYDVGGD